MVKLINGNLDEIIVFGDGLNDMKMFEQAPRSVAMKNGVEPLKQIATMVTEDIFEDGIQIARQKLGLI
ncbi:MAG: HAD hydrolase family protein [Beduini sp.]